MRQNRQLAAIMFTDIVGYTVLMGKDTGKALEIVHISKEIQKPLVEKHNGTWLKEMGDGAMAQFSSAMDAVNCSIEIQESARGKLDAKLRIGIHLGDVTVEEDDVHGDGVNVASRLESIADPGGVYISESIEKAIKGQTDVQAKYLGEIHLKNVAYGVRTYALQGVGLPVPVVREEKKLSGHLWAEVQRRGIIRAGATYVVLLLLLILLVPYAESLIDLPKW
ncbi:MAG: adenylate/guanylate cyclase domain-containing protein, partial [Bacteroidetes bacterium]|nr:adenylate/guanylate cyclase domain-containing protein [Bacteroidota bacterium]